jgi:S-adenosylhomocysteine hydrolase
VDEGYHVFSIKGEDTETYYKHIDACLDVRPHITMDDGADLVSTITATTDLVKNIWVEPKNHHRRDQPGSMAPGFSSFRSSR